MTITKELIDKIIDGKNAEASDEVINMLYQKSIEQLDRYKQEYASQLINPTEEETTEEDQ